MTDSTGLPVKGYKPTQSAENIALVNEFKVLEEQVLQKLDSLRAQGTKFDQRWVSIGFTEIQQAFMAINRSIFQPERIKLDE